MIYSEAVYVSRACTPLTTSQSPLVHLGIDTSYTLNVNVVILNN